MAKRKLAVSAPDTQGSACSERELQIRVWLEHYTEYKGTRAQLEDEGNVPPDLDWPKGKQWAEWTTGGTEFRLFRCRPEGMRGPAKLWLEGDFWQLRICPTGFDWSDAHIRLKARELRSALFVQTAEGRARSSQTWHAYLNASKDKRFQEFKSLIPGLVPPPRTRRRASNVEEKAHD